ncbi:hypothetical protein ACWKWC_02795 [Geodermatophilus nigrescens]
MAAGGILAGATPALAAPPTIEVIDVDAVFVDEVASAACGFEVVQTATGTVRIRTFEDDGTAVQEVRSVSITRTLSSPTGSIRFRDVGVDKIQVQPDGTVVLLVAGNVAPGGFSGALKIDLTTGEVILEPQRDRRERDLERICAALGG